MKQLIILVLVLNLLIIQMFKQDQFLKLHCLVRKLIEQKLYYLGQLILSLKFLMLVSMDTNYKKMGLNLILGLNFMNDLTALIVKVKRV